MTWLDSIRTALESLRANATRSILTVLGVIIGVAAVMAVVAVASGARTLIVGQVRDLGANLIMISPGTLVTGGVRLADGVSQTLSEDDALAIGRQLPAVQYAVPTVHGPVQLVHEDSNWSTMLVGTTSDFTGARNWDLLSGRDLLPEDAESSAKVALLGATVAQRLFGDASPLGAFLRIQKVPFTVVGVLAPKGQSKGGQDQDDLVVVPISTAKKRILGENPINARAVTSIIVAVRDGADVDAAERDLRALLRQQHRLQPQQEDDFVIKNLADVMALRQAMYRALTWLLSALAAVSLIVGGIGVMNVMLASVAERTREIGIRVAVGARRRDVLSQVLAESITLSVLGGMIGLLVGIVASALIAKAAGWPMEIRLDAILLAVGCSGAVGIVFGLYPAYRAASLDPIEALRHV
jgi:putative ABC transport system permease protein